MNKLILVRHGQSTANVDREMYHYPDSAVCLTEAGVRQAIECGQILKNADLNWDIEWYNFQAYSSQYTRAKQTARIVLDIMGFRGTNPTVVAALNERNYGLGHVVETHRTDPYGAPTEGESMIMTRRRLGYWFDTQISYLLTESDMIFFMHGESIKALTAHILDLSDTEMMTVPMKNAEPYMYIRENERWARRNLR